MARTIVGLEVTEECVRGAEVSLGRKSQLASFGAVALPPEAAHDSEVLDPSAVAVALRQLWASARFNSRHVVLGVASRRILVREYTTQAMRPEILRQALPYQVQDLLPVPASQAILDFYPVAQSGDEVSGLLVAAVAETIEQIIATLSRVKCRVDAVDLGAFALVRATAPLASPGEAFATISVGDHTTQVVVVRDGVPQFVRILPIDVSTSAVRRRASDPLVEDATLEFASLGAVRSRSAMRSTVAPAVADLAARMRSTLAFYATRPTATPLSQVFITGAGAAADGVMPALTAAIDVPMQTVTAADIITGPSMPSDPELALDLVGTIGLALGEV